MAAGKPAHAGSNSARNLRFKAINPGLEGLAWFCAVCDREVWRHVFDAGSEPVQVGYLNGCQTFNADPALRTCGTCRTVHPAGFRWAEIADELRAVGGNPSVRPHAADVVHEQPQRTLGGESGAERANLGEYGKIGADEAGAVDLGDCLLAVVLVTSYNERFPRQPLARAETVHCVHSRVSV